MEHNARSIVIHMLFSITAYSVEDLTRLACLLRFCGGALLHNAVAAIWEHAAQRFSQDDVFDMELPAGNTKYVRSFAAG